MSLSLGQLSPSLFSLFLSNCSLFFVSFNSYFMCAMSHLLSFSDYSISCLYITCLFRFSVILIVTFDVSSHQVKSLYIFSHSFQIRVSAFVNQWYVLHFLSCFLVANFIQIVIVAAFQLNFYICEKCMHIILPSSEKKQVYLKVYNSANKYASL